MGREPGKEGIIWGGGDHAMGIWEETEGREGVYGEGGEEQGEENLLFNMGEKHLHSIAYSISMYACSLIPPLPAFFSSNLSLPYVSGGYGPLYLSLLMALASACSWQPWEEPNQEHGTSCMLSSGGVAASCLWLMWQQHPSSWLGAGHCGRSTQPFFLAAAAACVARFIVALL